MRIPLLLVLVGMTAQAGEVAGHYVLRGVHEVGSEMMLNPDGTFEYMLAYGAADYWAKGTWRRQDDTVVLNSAGKKEAPFRLLRSAGEAAGVRVWVKAPNGNPVPNIDVGLRTANGSAKARTSAEGMAEFPDATEPLSVSFQIRVYSLQTEPFEVSSAHHDFYFEINGDAIMQVRFEDERLAIDGKDLMLRYWDKDNPMHYERQ